MPRFIQIPDGTSQKFELVNRPIPTPSSDEVVLNVIACGVCGGETMPLKNSIGTIQYPRVPGHEVVGRVHSVGNNVDSDRFKIGTRYGVSWHGGHCGGPSKCDPCLDGDYRACQRSKWTGSMRDGGYGEYVAIPWTALVTIPVSLSSIQAAPMLCGGATIYQALRDSHVLATRPAPTLTVLIQGIGGLGMFAIQYCKKIGFGKVIAATTSADKVKLAVDILGADQAVDVNKGLDGIKADIIMMTATSTKAAQSLIPCLKRKGEILMMSGGHDPIAIPPHVLLGTQGCVHGAAVGATSAVSEALASFAKLGIDSHVVEYPLEKAWDAYTDMVNNKVRFRGVLTTGAK